MVNLDGRVAIGTVSVSDPTSDYDGMSDEDFARIVSDVLVLFLQIAKQRHLDELADSIKAKINKNRKLTRHVYGRSGSSHG